MLYLEKFTFPDAEEEFDFFLEQKRTCYDSFYPFQVLSKHQFKQIDFEPITILYGGNGFGKTTALHVIAEKLKLKRESIFNKSNFYEDYVRLCTASHKKLLGRDSCIITSDDVFDYMLNIRNLNEGIDQKREQLFEEFLEEKHANFRMESLKDYEKLKKVNQARRRTQSKYVRENLMDTVREYSNGESAFLYFTEKITEDGLFLLDEPENSLSPKKQQELVQFLEDSARFFHCQLIISTHSPFLLAMKGAKIYDLEEEVVDVKRWTELENVKVYYEFFKKHRDRFEE